LDRDSVLNVALMCHWTDGPTRVSIGHICQAAKVSKPSLYREFGSDDGLKDAVLDLYREMVLLDLSRFDAAPLIAFIATKEMNYGTETDGRISQGRGADRVEQWADAQAGG
jgi:AcrR family transcriptional regulator